MSVNSLPKFKIMQIYMVPLLCVALFILFTTPVTDGDCFWHLASGRWIVEHLALPASDPFSFMVTDHNPFRPDSARIPFLLKQYWLGQVIMYMIWKVGGLAGIVLLRASVYTALLILLFRWLRSKNSGAIPVALALLTAAMLSEIPNERPQLFSFILMPYSLFLLDSIHEPKARKTLHLLLLPAIMFLWANIHGAYILGVCLIIGALGIHIFLASLKKISFDFRFVICAVLSSAITLLNPAGALAWIEIFNTLPQYAASIYENLSPFHAALRLHDFHPSYWIYIFAASLLLILNFRTIRPFHLFVTTALVLLSFTAMRYMIFPLLAAPLIAGYMPEIRLDLPKGAAIAVLAVALFWSPGREVLAFRAAPSFPVEATAFINSATPAANLFNFYDWGGYLALNAPGFKTFGDGRGLVEEYSLLEDRVMNGTGWQETFDRYRITAVIIPGMSALPGTVYPLAEALSSSAMWQLVFADDKALVFIRLLPENRKISETYHLDRRFFLNHLVKSAERLLLSDPDREEYWVTKANALQLGSNMPEAAAAYRQVLRINSGNEWARRMLIMLESAK
ncbi:MAG: hypothetical protein HXX17_11205 [Geobacteraceae bacterium]|nr:hypothetical protein [Geobacteraceae bacterium]